MEAYKTVCPDCGYVRFWTGWKTGLGKTKEQLEQMSRDFKTCKKCGSVNAKTGSDRESEIGRDFAAMDKEAVRVIGDFIKERLGVK
ncbi:MAG: hypothetical protein WC310_02815 [Patescibacteria group bacterium]|jgi:hypothetical protein